MTSELLETAPESAAPQNHAWPMRLWLATPDWAFRVLGVAFFSWYVYYLGRDYWQKDFWDLGPWYVSNAPDGRSIHMPWVPILRDLTFVLIALSFCLRMPPRSRAANGWVVAYSLFVAFGPLIPTLLSPVLGWFDPAWQVAYDNFLWRNPITYWDVLIGGSMITVGNVLDIWGYAVLTRSFSIVPEARKLRTTGPYRFVRHPVYLGQFIAQGGVWLFFARLHVVWIGFYIVFVGLQLYRSKLEDRVLAEVLGDECRQWQKRTFWFV